MSNRTVFIIIGCVLLLFILSLSMCFEIKTVPDVNWNKSLKYELKDPNGTWLLKSMLEETYGKDKVQGIDSDSLNFDSLSTNNLYVYVGSSINFDYEKKDSLLHWVAKGNSALFITNALNFNMPYTYADMNDSTESHIYIEQSSARDSVLKFYYSALGDTIQNTFDYISYGNSLKEISIERYNYFTDENYTFFDPLIAINDSSSIFISRDFGQGFFYFHSIPKLFVNVAAFQDFHLDHYNYLVSNFDPNKIYLDEKRNDPYSSESDDPEKESPLQFILATPALKWAYYTLLSGLILFVLFGSKRKQKAIPTVEENKNTSLEYVQTVSQLYESQNQNRKLVQQMKHIFFAKMKAKYYLDHQDPEYVYLLSRKSKIDASEIETLIKKLDNSDHYEFTDNQLVKLYQRLETFYKNCK